MERMLRKKKDNSDYEIDRELTGKFAIEKNAEYQEKIEQLEEENKKLKEWNNELIENHKKDIDVLCEENKKLKKYYDRDKEELMESCYGLAKENDELKKKLNDIQEAYIRFEKLDSQFQKGLGELDQLIMNR